MREIPSGGDTFRGKRNSIVFFRAGKAMTSTGPRRQMRRSVLHQDPGADAPAVTSTVCTPSCHSGSSSRPTIDRNRQGAIPPGFSGQRCPTGSVHDHIGDLTV